MEREQEGNMNRKAVHRKGCYYHPGIPELPLPKKEMRG